MVPALPSPAFQEEVIQGLRAASKALPRQQQARTTGCAANSTQESPMSPRSPGPDDRRLAAAAVALQMVAAGAACGDPYWDDDATARAQQVGGYWVV